MVGARGRPSRTQRPDGFLLINRTPPRTAEETAALAHRPSGPWSLDPPDALAHDAMAVRCRPLARASVIGSQVL